MKVLFYGIVEGNGWMLCNLLGLLIFIGGGYLFGCYVLLLVEFNLLVFIVLVLKGGLFCVFGIVFGVMLVLVVKIMLVCLLDVLLGFGVGVMFLVMVFLLIMLVLFVVGDFGYLKFGVGFLVSFGLVVGVMGLFIFGWLMLDVYFGCEGVLLFGGIFLCILLFVMVIVLYNIFEGMVVGVLVGVGLDEVNGFVLGIVLQDVLEGLVVVLVLVGVGMLCFKVMLVGVVLGLVELLFVVFCVWLVGFFVLFLFWGLVVVGGVMFFVVIYEIIFEFYCQGYVVEVMLGLVFGFCLMMVLDIVLGQGIYLI